MTSTAELPLPHTDQYDWQRHAACRDMSPEVFFHPDNERGATRQAREEQARRVCARCPVMNQCLVHALNAREPYGVWGGRTESERRDLLRGSGDTHKVGA